MKQITIGFSKASSFFPIFSWLIMLTQKTPYSHVYLKYTDTDIQRNVYFQASHTAVNYMGEELFFSQETLIKEFNFNISDESFISVQQFALSNVGKSYGVLSILGLSIVQLASLFNIKIHNPFKEAGSTWICNQIQAAILEQCENIQLPMPLNDMTPKDMYNLVSSLPTQLS